MDGCRLGGKGCELQESKLAWPDKTGNFEGWRQISGLDCCLLRLMVCYSIPSCCLDATEDDDDDDIS